MLMKDHVSVAVVYASQQGNAQAIAEDLHEELKEHLMDQSVSLRLECISKLGNDPSVLSKSDCAIFIAATTGDGDPPDTARKLWRVLNKSKPTQSGSSKRDDSNVNPTKVDDGRKGKEKSNSSSMEVTGILSNIPPPFLEKTVSPVKVEDPLEKVNDDSHEKGDDDSHEKRDDSHEKVDDSHEKVDDSHEKVNDSHLKVDDAHLKVDDAPEKVDDAYEKVDDSHAKGDDSSDKVDDSRDPSSLNVTDDVVDVSESTAVSPGRLSHSGGNELSAEKPDAALSQATDDPRYESGIKDTNGKIGSNEQVNVPEKFTTASDLEERSKKVIDPKIELSHLTYTVLGLGDTNYTNFCNFGKNLDEILHQLGAQRFYTCGWADDGTGLEIVIEPWKEKFWQAISEQVVKLAKQKQQRASPTPVNKAKETIGDVASDGDVKKTLEKSMDVNVAKVVNDADYDFEVRKKNDVITKLENLHLNDIELRRLNHPLLHLEFSPEAKLTLPKIPTLNTIVLDFCDEPNSDDCASCYQNGALFPSAKSSVYDCNVVEFRHLSRSIINKPVKKVAEAILQPTTDYELDYEPGDSVGVLAHNHRRDVEFLLERLAVPPDRMCRLTKNPSAKKQLPQHLPVCSSLREIFTNCLEIRCVPKKALLLQFLNCCSDPHEIRCLQELVSKEGSEYYFKKVLENRITFLDLLFVFQSCRLEISVLLETLPRLLPRAYSLTSSPLDTTKRLSFVYSVTVIPMSRGRFAERKGVCTGLFDALDDQKSDDPAAVAKLALYLRCNQSFRLPTDYTKPIVMIGPGTGVAPFIGFLRHRKHQLDQNLIDASKVGESWLFFGCRFIEADELFKEEIQEFVTSKVLTNYYSCFSREHLTLPLVENGDKQYVQDLLRHHSSNLVSAVTEKDAVVYVCGDAANMAKDVYSTFSSILAEHFGDQLEGSRYLSEMQKDKRYLQDVWT